MGYPQQAPWTGIGSLQSDVHRLESELRRKADDYKVSALDSRVDALVSAVRDVGSVCDGILSRLQALEENQQEIQRQLAEPVGGEPNDT